MPPATTEGQPGNFQTDAAYPSKKIAFQAAGMITSIVDNLQNHDELRFTPAFMYAKETLFDLQPLTADVYSVYSLFSALIMHVYQMRSSVPSIVAATQERMRICMDALNEVSKVWRVAKMVHTLFQSILGNRMLEDRLQKAAGRRHKRPRPETRSLPEKDDQQKRKYDDVDLSFRNAPPAPQVSYERSRPQTPAVQPSGDLGPTAPVAPMAAHPNSPQIRQSNDGFAGGNSRGNTRPTTPFNPAYSGAATPPDLFLVTRDSPHISQSLWENFQPDHLFPENTNVSMPQFSNQQNLDPQLQMPPMQSPSILQQHTQGQQLSSQDTQLNMQGMQELTGATQVQGMQQQRHNSLNGWSNQFAGDTQSSDDSWSNNSRNQNPVVPTTLNVEDW